MKKVLLIILGVIVLGIVILFIVRFLTPEDNWIKDSRGVWVMHGNPKNTPAEVTEQQRLIHLGNQKFNEAQSSYGTMSNGPCLGEVAPDWVVDVVNSPRQSVDNLPQNQCPDYISGKDHHFIELDTKGNIVKVQ